ncbi:hypothetical protein Dimus_007107 [Dionaea muscipula]
MGEKLYIIQFLIGIWHPSGPQPHALHICSTLNPPSSSSCSSLSPTQASKKGSFFCFLFRLITMARKGAITLQKDVPWRATPGAKSIPKIHLSPVVCVPQNPHSNYALSIIKHKNPIGKGLAVDAILESAGPECIVPGQTVPFNLLGLKVWPVKIDLKFLEPVGRELKNIGRILDIAMNLANRAHLNR